MSHVAIVTGANHGIGAAVAKALARRGDPVLYAWYRAEDPDDDWTPQAYLDSRARPGSSVVSSITSAGGRAVGVAADLTDPAAPSVRDRWYSGVTVKSVSESIMRVLRRTW